jgi:hypothetical protein
MFTYLLLPCRERGVGGTASKGTASALLGSARLLLGGGLLLVVVLVVALVRTLLVGGKILIRKAVWCG